MHHITTSHHFISYSYYTILLHITSHHHFTMHHIISLHYITSHHIPYLTHITSPHHDMTWHDMTLRGSPYEPCPKMILTNDMTWHDMTRALLHRVYNVHCMVSSITHIPTTSSYTIHMSFTLLYSTLLYSTLSLCHTNILYQYLISHQYPFLHHIMSYFIPIYYTMPISSYLTNTILYSYHIISHHITSHHITSLTPLYIHALA
jgi:hypothetical protein